MAAKQGLYANINRRKRLGISRPKSKSTISKKAYANMKKGFPKSMKSGGMSKVKKFNSGALSQVEPQTQGPMLPDQDSFLRGVSPYIEKSGEGQEGSYGRIAKEKAGVDFDTKLGNIGLGYTKSTSSSMGNPDLIQKNLGATYRKEIPLDESGKVDIYGGLGKQTSQMAGYDETRRKMGTYNVGARYTYNFGGGKIQGGLSEKGKFNYVKGGFEEGNYQDYVNELLKK